MSKSLNETLKSLEDGSILVLERTYRGKTDEVAGVWSKETQFCLDSELDLYDLSLDGVNGCSSSSCIVKKSSIRRIYLLEKREIYSRDEISSKS